MKILKHENDLRGFLQEIHNKVVYVVSAFAIGTENVVDTLLNQGNKLELLIGTINSFSSPNFFDYCKEISTDRFSMSVDFRYQNSIHWKLYLVEPETVVIGSANFTSKGLSLERDTCVVINDESLLKEYLKQIGKIKSSDDVVGCDNERFQGCLKTYKENHRRMQAGRVRTVHSKNAIGWLADEENQLIQVFIWDSKHTKSTIRKAHKILGAEVDEKPEVILRDFFTIEDKEEGIPYKQGDLVLCMNENGSYPDFYSFDRIINHDGTNYIYSYKQKKYTRPFRLDTKLKKSIKDRAKDWYEGSITEIDRAEIERLLGSTESPLQGLK
jgi:hypothetical protein